MTKSFTTRDGSSKHNLIGDEADYHQNSDLNNCKPIKFLHSLDPNRPSKTRCIVIDEGGWIKLAITPDEHDTVVRILREKTSPVN
jgi:hypothetical protein